FNLPGRVIIRRGAIEDVPVVLQDLGCSSVLIVSDINVRSLYGVRVEQLLLRENIKPYFTNVSSNDHSFLEKLLGELAGVEFRCVAGMGGGRPVDAGKFLAYKLGRIFVSIPTSISHDGFASPIVALKDDQGNPLSLFTRTPMGVIVDLEIVSHAPRRLLSSGFADIIAKITSVADARLAIREKGEYTSEMALRMAEGAARMVLEEVEEIASFSERGLRLLAEAGLLAGMAMSIAGSSRPCSGSEHLFSHALDKLYGGKGLHGEQVGLGTIIAAYLHGFDWAGIKKALRRVGAPTTIGELGLSVEEAVQALLVAPRLRDRYTILHKLVLDENSAKEVITRTVVS
ncbi:MAG: iron-containing alcohol dehydrogenase, partial [Infirmifilum sp.]